MGKIKRGPELDTTLGDMVSDALQQITTLGEEFREIFDNSPESLQGNDVNQTRDSTASTIEGLSEPDVPEALAALPMKWAAWQSARKGRGLSRADQAAEAAAMLEAVRDLLDERDTDEDAQALRSEVDDLHSEIDGLEWPGQFG